MADRHQRKPAIRLQHLHLRAERVEMADDRTRTGGLLAAKTGADGAPARQIHMEAKCFQLADDITRDGIRIASRTWNREERLQLLLQIINIDRQPDIRLRDVAGVSHVLACCAARTAVGMESGKSMSMKRSAVGWGS